MIGYLCKIILHCLYFGIGVRYIYKTSDISNPNYFLANVQESSLQLIQKESTSTLYKSNWMVLFPKLEKLSLHACSSLDMVFDMQKSQLNNNPSSLDVLFAELKEIEISWLSKLRHIWGNNNVPSCYNTIQGFHNLKSIKVKKCDSLRHVLTPSIARALTHLQKMVIQSCQSMEKIIGEEVDPDDEIIDDHENEKINVETLVFDQLESLTLKDLPCLVSVCPDSYEIVWPSLRSLCIDGCPWLKTSSVCTQTDHAKEENCNASSSSTTTCDTVAYSTSKEDSPKFLQCCFGCTPHAFSNKKAKVLH